MDLNLAYTANQLALSTEPTTVLISLDAPFIHGARYALQICEPATPCRLCPPIGHAMATHTLFLGHLFVLTPCGLNNPLSASQSAFYRQGSGRLAVIDGVRNRRIMLDPHKGAAFPPNWTGYEKNLVACTVVTYRLGACLSRESRPDCYSDCRQRRGDRALPRQLCITYRGKSVSG